MLRFPPEPLACAAGCEVAPSVVVIGGREAGPVVAGRVGGGSFESEAPRRWEISTLTVLMARAVTADVPATSSEYPYPEMLLEFSLLSYRQRRGDNWRPKLEEQC